MQDSGSLPTIQAVNLTKVFGKRTCVDNLSFSVHSGELYALLGDNGAGKTTTINMLTTLLSPSSGEFYISGHNGIKDIEKCKGAFGVVSQEVSIYQDLTAYENMAFVARLYGMDEKRACERIGKMLRQAGLAERANDRAQEYSTGMQRKLSIALAMLPEPKVIFMDEPTVGLDPSARHQIWASLKELKAHGVTILLTTHYLEEAELLADRIGIIRQGKLVIEGTISELKDKIQSIRSIAISFTQRCDEETLFAKLSRLQERVQVRSRFDSMRNTLYLAQPPEVALPHFLNMVLAWLEAENLAFHKFATNEPNLEEVFLSVTRGTEAMASAQEIGDGQILD